MNDTIEPRNMASSRIYPTTCCNTLVLLMASWVLRCRGADQVCRLRERYRECLKEEIGHTVASPAEVNEELRHLFRVLARR
jgi:hypothetical protein